MVNEYNNVDRGNPKDNAAILICYASENIKSDIAKFVNDYQNLFVDMFDLIKHGNNEIHGNYHSNSLSDVTDDYIKYEEIVRKFYEFFIGGEMKVMHSKPSELPKMMISDRKSVV